MDVDESQALLRVTNVFNQIKNKYAHTHTHTPARTNQNNNEDDEMSTERREMKDVLHSCLNWRFYNKEKNPNR